MTVDEAKEFLINLQSAFVNDKDLLSEENEKLNCYQCVIQEYEKMKSQNRLFQEMKDKTIEQQQEILELKARLYDSERVNGNNDYC